MNKSIQVSTRETCIDLYISVCVRDYPAFQWINLYKFPRERLILCINLYISVYEKDYPAYQWINLYKSSRERLSCVSMNKFIQVFARETNSLYRFICKCLRERLSCVSMNKSIQVFTRD
jgi:hypothetical protein